MIFEDDLKEMCWSHQAARVLIYSAVLRPKFRPVMKVIGFFLVFNGILSRILMAWTAWYLLNIRCMVSAWLRTFYSQTPDAMALSEPPFLSDAVDTGGGFPWFGLVGL